MKKMKNKILVFIITGVTSSIAGELGTYGSTYEIKEVDAIEQIERKARDLERSGALKRMQDELKEKVKSKIHAPNPVKNVHATTAPRQFSKDLTVTLTHDIYDQNGKVLFKAGTSANPLMLLPSSKRLLFIDGSTEKQVNWALKEYNQLYDKIVLISGALHDLNQKHNFFFYFDQHGKLTRYFGIEQVPAIVKQEGNKLLITEILL